MIPRCFAFAFLFACILIAGCSPQSSAPDINLHLESGRSYFEQGQLSAAMIEARLALQLDEKNEVANLLMSDILLTLGSARQALRTLQSIESETYEYHSRLIDAMLAVGKYGTALHLLRRNESSFAEYEVESLLKSARARSGLQDIENATLNYRKALNLDPSNIEATLGLIGIDAALGRLEEADSKLLKLLDTHPEHLDTLILMANVYIRQGRLEEAEARLTEAISVLPATDIFTQQRAGLLRILIRLLAFQGNSAEALIYQNQLAAAFPYSEEIKGKMDQVSELVQKSDLESALVILDEIELIAPGNETTGTLRGVIAFLQGDNLAASELFADNVDPEVASSKTLQLFAANQFHLNQPHKVVSLLKEKIGSSNNPETLALFGVAALSADASKEGVAALRKAIDLAPDNVRLSVILASHLRINNPAEALEELEAAHTRKPDDLYLNLALMAALMDLGHVERAAEFVESILLREQQTFASQFLAANYYAQAGEAEKAIQHFQKAADADNTDLRPLLNIAALLNGLGRYEEAEAQISSILKQDKTSFEAYQGLLSIYIARNERSKGIAHLSSLAEEHEVSEPLLVLSNFFARTGEAGEAETFLVQAGSGNGKSDRLWRTVNASIYAERAQLSYQRGEFDEARSFAFTALNSYPANRQLLGLLISIELGAGALGEAKKVLEQLKLAHPDSQLGFIREGNIAIAEGRLDSAAKSYAQAWSIGVDDRLGQQLFAVYEQLNKPVQANQLLSEWRKAVPLSVPATVNYANQLAANGDSQAAIAAYESFLESRPGSIVVKNNLAWLYLDSGAYPQAVKISKEAHEQLPSAGAVADTYGWALYKQGEITQAVNMLKLAIKLLPDDEIQAHLDEALSAERSN